MTVMDISKDGKRLTGSYTTPDGVRHDEQLKTDQVVRVAI